MQFLRNTSVNFINDRVTISLLRDIEITYILQFHERYLRFRNGNFPIGSFLTQLVAHFRCNDDVSSMMIQSSNIYAILFSDIKFHVSEDHIMWDMQLRYYFKGMFIASFFESLVLNINLVSFLFVNFLENERSVSSLIEI